MKRWWWRFCLFPLCTLTAGALCFTTPKTALDAELSGRWHRSEVDEQGYRLLFFYSDPLLWSRLAKIGSCSHSDWPPSILLVRGSSDTSTKNLFAPQSYLVHPGDAVHLWYQDGNVRMELRGVAEEQGMLGSTVNVRIPTTAFTTEAGSREGRGVVRGPSDMELLP